MIGIPESYFYTLQRLLRNFSLSADCQMTPHHHSDFEKNVIMKNIEEGKKMERELGLYNLSEDIRNIDKPTSTFQEHLDDIMGDDV